MVIIPLISTLGPVLAAIARLRGCDSRLLQQGENLLGCLGGEEGCCCQVLGEFTFQRDLVVVAVSGGLAGDLGQNL